MTPPRSDRYEAVKKRQFRNLRRIRLLRVFGFRCAFADDLCRGRLEFAHRFPVRRGMGPDGQPRHRSQDELAAAVRADPFAFLVVCRRHHHKLDGPRWRGWDV